VTELEPDLRPPDRISLLEKYHLEENPHVHTFSDITGHVVTHDLLWVVLLEFNVYQLYFF
jgi:hypothetical protein